MTSMITRRSLVLAYLAATLISCLILAYPAMIYYDLAGQGGYDGFASPRMMREHGVWREETGHTPTYYAYLGMSLCWLLSVVNLPFAAMLLIRSVARGECEPAPPTS